MSEGYSLEKWHAAPETTITPAEQEFLDRYEAAVEEATRGRVTASRLLASLFRSNTWTVLRNQSKAELLKARRAESKKGQMDLARKEAEMVNAEYDRLADEAEAAAKRFSDYVEFANGGGEKGEEQG